MLTKSLSPAEIRRCLLELIDPAFMPRPIYIVERVVSCDEEQILEFDIEAELKSLLPTLTGSHGGAAAVGQLLDTLQRLEH